MYTTQNLHRSQQLLLLSTWLERSTPCICFVNALRLVKFLSSLLTFDQINGLWQRSECLPQATASKRGSSKSLFRLLHVSHFLGQQRKQETCAHRLVLKTTFNGFSFLVFSLLSLLSHVIPHEFSARWLLVPVTLKYTRRDAVQSMKV